jgi:hypothetical protein
VVIGRNRSPTVGRFGDIEALMNPFPHRIVLSQLGLPPLVRGGGSSHWSTLSMCLIV